jgi:2-polyprenyl-3-methyl-5-hydroxy-6-metoxy-1,4-benzoquinol methylase
MDQRFDETSLGTGRAAAEARSPAEAVLSAADDDDDFARIVLPLMEGRRVLDVGCINHAFFATGSRRRDSSFFRIESAADYVLGVDNAKRAVNLARAHGHNVVLGDAETFRAETQFDVVHGGDIIEHLSNPGLFLDCCHDNLTDNGHLILSTPNTFSLANAYAVLSGFTNDPEVHPQHTAYFSPTTLNELVRRHGFETIALHTAEIRTRGLTRSERVLLALNGAVTRLVPRFKRTLIGMFRKRRALRSQRGLVQRPANA